MQGEFVMVIHGGQACDSSDAGLYTFQRTLDIRFVDDELELHKQGRIRGSAFVSHAASSNFLLKKATYAGHNQQAIH